MIPEIIILASMAILIGLLLGLVSRLFGDPEDPKITKVYQVLPGVNCGGCGYANCEKFSEAVVEDPQLANGCVIGGREVGAKICKILGVKVGPAKRNYALVHCVGGANCTDLAGYEGVKTCAAASTSTSHKACTEGCMGFGDCIHACTFDALHMGKDGVPVVNRKDCVGCGLCVKACPNNIIRMHTDVERIHVYCNSHDAPKVKSGYCTTGCIGCGICAKVCPKNAIEMKDNLPVINHEKCIACGACVAKCPRKVILKDG